MKNDVYIQCGCKDRAEYLKDLAADNDTPLDIVLQLADLFGPEEDFDGLVTAVQDYYFLPTTIEGGMGV